MKRNKPEIVIHSRKSPLTRKEIELFVRKIYKRLPQLRNISLSIAVIDDIKMKEINLRFKGRNSSTDVLSFFYTEPFPLGEVIISGDQSYKNARRYKSSARKEFLMYLIHGILHILGYNDSQEGEKKKMFYLQKKILEEIEI